MLRIFPHPTEQRRYGVPIVTRAFGVMGGSPQLFKNLIFAVNYARQESDPEPLDATALEELAEEMGARVARGVEAYEQLDRSRRFGQEIWKPILWALLIFLFLEILVQQWLGRARV